MGIELPQIVASPWLDALTYLAFILLPSTMGITYHLAKRKFFGKNPRAQVRVLILALEVVAIALVLAWIAWTFSILQ